MLSTSLLDDLMLREQAKANSLEQFLASPTLERLALAAAYSSADAFDQMNEIAQRGGDPQRKIVDLLGRFVYLEFNGLTGTPEEEQSRESANRAKHLAGDANAGPSIG